LLHWSTAQEENSKEFVVERSTDNVSYAPAGVVSAAGNSHLELDYSFVDESPYAGRNYYRIKEVDLDGKAMYSPMLAVNFEAGAVVKLLPNPANTSIVWSMNAAQSANGLLQVSDLAGRVVLARNVQWQSGVNSFTIGVSALPVGTYVMTLVDGAGTRTSREFQIRR
jgi:hypothetical protein